MQLDLGNNIRQLRRRDKRTQEALADALGVTSQAVSRWESGGSYPDMNLIPSIANFFGVSIDELFGYEGKHTGRIDTLAAEIDRMNQLNSGKDVCIAECIAMARSALVEFPGNEKLMISLASVLYKAGRVRYGECHLTDEEGYDVYDTEKHRTYEEWQEAIPLYEKALQTLPRGKLRDRATDELSQLYLNLGEHEKGMALADLAPDMWSSRDFLRAYACDGKQDVKAHSELLLQTMLLAQIEAENLQLSADSQARHDRRHHNLVMLEFANNNDIDSIREYLSNLVESESQVWGEVRFCEHTTVNTILTVYERRAKEEEIPVKISAYVSRDIAVLPQDLVIVIANLFENAIHATQKLKTKDRSIQIYIKESAQRLVVKIENPCRANLAFDETLYGVGISSVIAATNKYDGMYDFTAEDGIFSAKISLNLE